jgi:hypothetical protein
VSGRHARSVRRAPVLLVVATVVGVWLGVRAPDVSPVAPPAPAAAAAQAAQQQPAQQPFTIGPQAPPRDRP